MSWFFYESIESRSISQEYYQGALYYIFLIVSSLFVFGGKFGTIKDHSSLDCDESFIVCFVVGAGGEAYKEIFLLHREKTIEGCSYYGIGETRTRQPYIQISLLYVQNVTGDEIWLSGDVTADIPALTTELSLVTTSFIWYPFFYEITRQACRCKKKM